MASQRWFFGRLERQAFAREAMVAGMRISGVPRPTDDEVPITDMHLNGAVVICSFVQHPDAHKMAPVCPYEAQCDGNCMLLQES